MIVLLLNSTVPVVVVMVTSPATRSTTSRVALDVLVLILEAVSKRILALAPLALMVTSPESPLAKLA